MATTTQQDSRPPRPETRLPERRAALAEAIARYVQIDISSAEKLLDSFGPRTDSVIGSDLPVDTIAVALVRESLEKLFPMTPRPRASIEH